MKTERIAPASVVTNLPALTPSGMLAEYRRLSPDDVKQQAEMFRRMPNSEQRELLFYMTAHATKAVQIIHALLDPEKSAALAFRGMEGATKQ